jgi:chromate transporter
MIVWATNIAFDVPIRNLVPAPFEKVWRTLSSSHQPSDESLTFLQAARFWLKLGLISFGGPAGQIALMHRELVELRRWISDRRFLHALNYCLVLPGPEAQQLATYIGWLFHGIPGGIIAGGLFVLPSLILLVLLSALYMALGTQPWAIAGLAGAKLAVIAIVAAALIRLGRRALHGWLAWTLALGSFLSLTWLGLSFPLIILAAGLIGLLAGHRGWQASLADGANGQAKFKRIGDEVIRYLHDDQTPVPEHAQFRPRKASLITAACALLWLIPLLALVAWQGSGGLFPRMATFFSLAALVTFGGAYAVLPYVAAQAVDRHGWLSPQQMIDGLALGETTPGPLIMVVAFVGYLGGAQASELGAVGGLCGACVATWYTFLPSFLFIFLGAPLIEQTRGSLHLAAPLRAISAAVVGGMAQLAIRFVRTTFWPDEIPIDWPGRFSSADWLGILFAATAIWLLVRWQLNTVWLVAAAVLFGLLRGILAS